MEINATIIVQAIHFALAYVILKNLFFTPAVRIVLCDREKEQAIQDQIAACRTAVQKTKQAMNMQWQVYQREYVQQMPPAQETELFVFKGIRPALVAPVLDEAHEQQLEKEVAQSIVAAVNHVF